MKVVKHDLGEFPRVEIVGISDAHIGHPNHKVGPLNREIEWLKAAPNRFCFLDGDMTETALRDSYGEIYDQPISPQKQAEEVSRILGPVKDRILGAVSGNHEERVRQRTSFDPAMIYASALGVPYEPGSMVLLLSFGKKSRRLPVFSIYFTHGWGAARSFAKFGQPALLKQVLANADVYVTAHTHSPVNYPLDTFEIDYHKGNIQRTTQRFVTLGASLDHAEYAERKGLGPTTMEYPKIELFHQVMRHGGAAEKRVVIHSS